MFDIIEPFADYSFPRPTRSDTGSSRTNAVLEAN